MKVCTFAIVGILSALFGANVASGATAAPSPSAGATASPAATLGADTTARAKEWLHRLQTGDIDRSQLTSTMNADLTPDVIKQIRGKIGPLGDPQSFTLLGQQSVESDETAYVFRVVFKTTTLNEMFVLDKDGKVAGIQFPPAQ
jgi:hypothetical protein